MNGKVIVVGNEKGGAGKTTVSMHLIVSILYKGFSVGSIDLDSRQLSLTHYIENRRKSGNFPMPSHDVLDNESLNPDALLTMINRKKSENHFTIIDTPGSHNKISHLAHSYSDVVLTPMNDSFLDLDLLARLAAEDNNKSSPGLYSEVLWKQKITKIKREKKELDWIVMKNRLSSIGSNNKKKMDSALKSLSKKLGFRVVSGFSERVIFRELFLDGLTLLDIFEDGSTARVNISHIAARQELRNLISAIGVLETVR